jgi:hypothetical protein
MDVHTALTEAAVEFQNKITHALRNELMKNLRPRGAVVDTVVSQRELRRFYYNAKASVNFKISKYDTDKNTSL